MTATPVRSRSAPPVGTVLKGNYQLVRFLGAGGMGAVYEALAPDGARLALKVLLEIPNNVHGAETVGRFEREARVMAAVESEHIVRIVKADFDEELGIPFIVMPLMSGLDLAQLIDKVGALHPTVAVRILRQACRGIAAAHQAGIVHRDIKPANIFLDQEPSGRVTVRVLDFGIAKWADADSSLTQTGSMMGTMKYMSPEQTLDAKGVGPPADVWSLAVTLYEMLAGADLYPDAQEKMAIHIAIHTRDVPSVQGPAPWIDPGLAVALHGALIRNFAHRCPSAVELAEVLEPFAFGSDELDSGMLVGVSEQLQAVSAAPAVLLKEWSKPVPSSAAPELDATVADGFLGQKLGGRYELLWRIGAGGMGAVYEALGADGCRYAVKVIAAELVNKKGGAMARFVREARLVSLIDSEHVVRVVDADTDASGESPYIVMDILRGSDLSSRIRRHGPLKPATAARVFIQACRGIQAAHDKGLVHRDIKPANLFLHELPSGEVVVKVCDFGIAKQVTSAEDQDSANLTRTGGVMGSPMYMSPEQAKNAKEVDARSDIWSVGISLYEALCGEPPWAGRRTVGEIMLAIYLEPIPHLQDSAEWVPPGLVDILHKTLHRKPADRFASMTELAEALEPFAREVPTLSERALAPIDVSLRGVKAMRARSAAVSSLGPASITSTQLSETPMIRGRGALVAAGAAVLIAVGAGGLYLKTKSPPTTTAVSAISEKTATPTVSLAVSAFVAIEPSDAKVSVNGEVAIVEGGKFTLHGEPGDAFNVILDSAGSTLTQTVVLRKDGTPNPDRLVVHVAATDAASPSASPKIKPFDPLKPLASVKPSEPLKPPEARVVDPPKPSAPPAPKKGLGMRTNW